jgi:glutamate carboxypeptidase
MKEILRFCESQGAWMRDTLEVLVRLESPTTDKAAVDRCGAELERRLVVIGAHVQRLPRNHAGDHLLAEFGCGASQLLILGHFDTVWPVGQLERMPLRVADGRLYGPGSFDMKAGIVIGMTAARALYECGVPLARRLVMLWTSDEEIGSTSSRSTIEEEARRSDAVFVLEPALPGGAVKTMRKGCGEFELIVRGVAAHAGVDPGKGASAIHELAHQIGILEQLGDIDRGVSINVGTISGGIRTNVIAEEAHATIDVRVPAAVEAARIEAAIRGLRPRNPRTSLQLAGGIDRPPLERTPAVVRLFELARNVAAEIGVELEEGSTGGGSDGNFTAALGVPTLDGLGAVGDGAHALHEHVELELLPMRAALLAELIARCGHDNIGAE